MSEEEQAEPRTVELPEEPPPLPAVALDDRYRERGLLGEGGSGRVALAHDQWLGRPVALKVLRGELRSSRRMRDQFLREAWIQGQLEHPSIVPIYDLGASAEGAPYFTMREVRGATLEAAIAEAPSGEAYDPRRLLSVFGQVCLTVQFAHQRGVVHRDLKPSNVMLGSFGEIYVLDWGVARTHADAPSGVPIGTPGYMAPEQIEGGEPSPAADVYALGVILFEILTRSNPHPGATPGEVLAATRAGVQERARAGLSEAEAPPELAELCAAALALDPAKRPAEARDLHDAVDRFLAGERDLELRRRLSQEHASEAKRLAGGALDVERRRMAMQEVGRALALDPGNAVALGTMVDLLRTPLAEIPPEVQRATEAGYRDRLRAIGKLAGVAYAAMLAIAPVVVFAGMTRVAPFALFFGGCALAGLFSLAASRSGDDRLALAALVTSTVGTAATAWIYGPLVIMPQAVIVNMMLYCFVLRPRFALPAILLGLVAVSVPIALELAGVTGAYRSDGETLVIAEQALRLSRETMLTLGLAAAVFGLVTGGVATAFFHRRLLAVEKELTLREWHLRQVAGAPEKLA